jgi:hypothetical protein
VGPYNIYYKLSGGVPYDAFCTPDLGEHLCGSSYEVTELSPDPQKVNGKNGFEDSTAEALCSADLATGSIEMRAYGYARAVSAYHGASGSANSEVSFRDTLCFTVPLEQYDWPLDEPLKVTLYGHVEGTIEASGVCRKGCKEEDPATWGTSDCSMGYAIYRFELGSHTSTRILPGAVTGPRTTSTTILHSQSQSFRRE